MKTTKQHKKFWASRKIDWQKSYTDTWNHPHRFLISGVLKTFNWISLIEIGCGSGPNLVNILKTFQGKEVGGIDINPDAIEAAKKTFGGGMFKVSSGDDIMLSDDSTDVVLSDMCLIYVDPFSIDRYIKEIRRIARNHVVLCEFHSTSLFARLKLWLTSGYFAHNYKKLLEKHDFYDVMLYKLPIKAWPGGEPQKTFCYIIIANVPSRK